MITFKFLNYLILFCLVILSHSYVSAASAGGSSGGGGSAADGAGLSLERGCLTGPAAGVCEAASSVGHLVKTPCNWGEGTLLGVANAILKDKPEIYAAMQIMKNIAKKSSSRDKKNSSSAAVDTSALAVDTSALAGSQDSITAGIFQKCLSDALIPFEILDNLYKNYFTQLQASKQVDPAAWHSLPPETISGGSSAGAGGAGQENKAFQALISAGDTLSTDVETDPTDTLPFVQQVTVDSGSKVAFIGDLHGSVHSLLRNILHLAQQGYIKNNWKFSQGFNLMILGDMTDYGCYGIEVIYILLRLKLANWNNVFFVRGNHENFSQATGDGFIAELKNKYSEESQHKALVTHFIRMSAMLPLAIYLRAKFFDKYIQCCHGGLEPYYLPNDFLKAVCVAPVNSAKQYDFVSRNVPGLADPVDSGLSKHAVGSGFQWSDFTGMNKDEYNAYCEKRNSWRLNEDRGFAGFKANNNDVQKYQYERPLVLAFIRGHQDSGACCKLVVAGKKELQPWRSCRPTIDSDFGSLLYDRLLESCADWNVITLVSAPGAKVNETEGYGILVLPGREDASFSDARFCVYENVVPKKSQYGLSQGYVCAKICERNLDLEPTQSHEWTEASSDAGVSEELAARLLGTAKTIIVVGKQHTDDDDDDDDDASTVSAASLEEDEKDDGNETKNGDGSDEVALSTDETGRTHDSAVQPAEKSAPQKKPSRKTNRSGDSSSGYDTDNTEGDGDDGIAKKHKKRK